MPRDYNNRRSTRARSRNNSSGFGWIAFGVFIGLAIAGVLYWKHNAPHPIAAPPHAAIKTEPPSIAAKAPQKAAATPEFDFYTVLPNMQVASTGPAKTTQPPPAATAPVATAPEAPTAAAPVAEGTPAPTTPVAAESPPPAKPVVASLVMLPDAPPTPAPTRQPTTAAPPVNANPSVSANGYLVQLASLKNYAEADRLKAQLTMQGFDVTIQTSSVNGQTFNRVVMGPYASRQAALQQQMQLQKSGIASILIKTAR